MISKGFSGHGVANRDAPFDALLKRLRLDGERLETWNRDEQHLLRRFDNQPRQLRRGGRSASAPCPARHPGKRKPEGHDSGPFANYPGRSTTPRSAPSPSPVTADFVRSAEPFNRISLLVAEIIDAHERYAFRGEKLHKSDSHSFGGSQYRVLPNFKRNLSLFLAPRHFNRKV